MQLIHLILIRWDSYFPREVAKIAFITQWKRIAVGHSRMNSTEEPIYSLTIHRRVDQDTEPWRACIQPCHDNRLFRTFLIIMIIVTHRPVPTRTPPTIFWLSVDMYRLWMKTYRERQIMCHISATRNEAV